LFFKVKTCGPGASILWTGGQWSTVDYGRQWPWSSPELSPCGTARLGSSPRGRKKDKRDLGGGPTVVNQNGGGFLLWESGLELRETIWNVAKCCEEGWGGVRRLL
jgi:hypothetical protein